MIDIFEDNKIIEKIKKVKGKFEKEKTKGERKVDGGKIKIIPV